MTKRVYFVDFARSFAIFLALFNHSMNDFNVWHDYSYSAYAVLKIVTSSATPVFLFLFGMMLELVYFRRLRDRGMGAIKPQLMKRSLQCYIGFMLTSVAGFMGGLNDVKEVIGTAVFAANNHYGNILKLYSVAILLAMPLLVLRLKIGIWKVFLISLSYWLLYPLFQLIEIGHPNVELFTSTIFGIGYGSGPSVLHSMSIIVLGMLCSYFITQERDTGSFVKKCLIILLVMSVPIAYFLITIPYAEFMEYYLGNVYRRMNHPVYYLVTGALAIINVIIFSMLIPIGSQIKEKYQNLLLFGRNSLSSYTIGNIILNLIFFQIQGTEWNIWVVLMYILFVFGVIYIYEGYQKRQSVVL